MFSVAGVWSHFERADVPVALNRARQVGASTLLMYPSECSEEAICHGEVASLVFLTRYAVVPVARVVDQR